MIDDTAGRPGARTAAAGRSRPVATHTGRWGERSLRFVAALFAIFLGLPVLTLVGRAILDGSLRVALASPEVLDALWLSLVTTAISLVITVTLGLPLAIYLSDR